MEKGIKYGSTLAAFGGTADRFVLSGYKKALTVPEMMAIAATVEGVEGIELVGNWQLRDDNVDQIKAALAETHLQLSCVTPDIWTQAKWAKGSLAARDAETRAAAIAEITKCMDLAAAMQCSYVDVWLGQDGYDYPFQGDFIEAWDRMVEGLRACADHRGDIKLLVEYKPKEPRTHCYIATAAKTILLVDEVDRDNVGALLDTGHGWAAGENVAESIALLKRFGNKLWYMHLNDNYRVWDDDMMVGSVHTIESLEMFYWLDAIGFQGWCVMDVFPYREDSYGAVSESIRWIKALRRALKEYGHDKVAGVIARGDAVEATRMAREMLLGT